MKNPIRVLGALLVTGWLALTANSAWAIPFTVQIDATLLGGIGGTWELDGPTDLSDGWFAALGSTYSRSYDIAPGDYEFEIGGLGIGVGFVSWSLIVGNTLIGPNHIGVALFRVFHDETVFVANAVAVPEPGVVGLLGIGLLGTWLATRRRIAK